MRTLDELGISPAPWFARLGVMEGDFVNSGAKDNEDGEVCAVTLHGCDLMQSHANARLIAAAPMLYEDLAEACREFCFRCKHKDDADAADICDQCIVSGWKESLAAASGESEVAK